MLVPAPLRLEPAFFPKLWGGHRIRQLYYPTAPEAEAIGEAWLVADHPNHESVITDGPHGGQTLRQLLNHFPEAMLGSHARLTVHGRFPLLLKILDAAEPLSVQVHPDDDAAARLGEPDVGKTEMWHVLHADPGAELICGLRPGLSRESLAEVAEEGAIEKHLYSFTAEAGTTVFVPAGTVHAIGGGLVLAEIQQNSDITYRIYDWSRVDDAGRPRDLHLDKSAEVADFSGGHGGPAQPLSYSVSEGEVAVLGACRYFAGERIRVSGVFTRETRGCSFHILLVVQGTMTVRAGEGCAVLAPGQCALVPGACPCFSLEGGGEVLDFYVPDLRGDVVEPLLRAGHAAASIVLLGGGPLQSDLGRVLG
ncbi:MAG: class I mannose-6-phosphate isomerase [Candidatus Hydrogenedentes bacterium]|nr:class I mannose-6-phosphate isomerase [Candidatus Hydrogenedentota bacterium]